MATKENSRRGFGRDREPRYWTPERVARLTELWKKGVAAKVIGAKLDPPRSGQSVVTAAYRLGLEPRQFRHPTKKVELRVKMDSREYEAIGLRASLRGMNRSAYIRRLVQNDIIRDVT